LNATRGVQASEKRFLHWAIRDVEATNEENGDEVRTL
jgi:hypothetical protein